MGQSESRFAQNSAGAARSAGQTAAHQLEDAARHAAEAARAIRQQQAAAELHERVEYLAQIENGLHSATQRLDERRRRDPLTDDEQQELAQIAARQGQVEQETRQLAGKMPSPSFEDALHIAAGDMGTAKENLNRQPRDAGPETGAAEQRAARTLEAVATALSEQAQQGSQSGDASGQGGQSGSAQQAQQAAVLGDLALAHSLEEQIRERTGTFDWERPRNAEQKLTNSQLGEARRLVNLQHSTKEIAVRSAQTLAAAPGIQQETEMAGGEMGIAEGRLAGVQTGTRTQSAEDAALRHLDAAIKLVRESMQQQQQQQQQQQAGGQGMPQPVPAPSSRGGMSPVMRLQAAPRGSLATPDPGAAPIGALSARGQRTLQEAQQERVPAEYQDAVNRYYRSLATHRQ
jgi:hypothetical protein